MEPVIALTRAEYKRYFCSDWRTPAVTYRDTDIVITEATIGVTGTMEPVIALTRAEYTKYFCSDWRTPAVTHRDIDIVITEATVGVTRIMEPVIALARLSTEDISVPTDGHLQ